MARAKIIGLVCLGVLGSSVLWLLNLRLIERGLQWLAQ